jgi:hypothetical protein
LQAQQTLDQLLAATESDDPASLPFIEYRKSVASHLALEDGGGLPYHSNIPWPTFVHFPTQSFSIPTRAAKCACFHCRRVVGHNRDSVYEADIHLMDDMVSFIEAYVRWGIRKGAYRESVVEEMRSKWKRILNAAVGDREKRWQISLILGAINLAEERLDNISSSPQ